MVKWTFSILFLELLDVFFGHAAGPPFLQWSVMPPAPWVAKPPNAPILGVSWGGNHGREPIIDWRIWFQHVSTITTYPLVICYIAIENGYLYWIYPLKMVIQWFSIVMLVYQRVIRLNPLIDSNNNDYVPLPEGSRLISKSQYMSICGVSIM